MKINEKSVDAFKILNKVMCIKCACRFHDKEMMQSCDIKFHEKMMYQHCIWCTKKNVTCIAISKLIQCIH